MRRPFTSTYAALSWWHQEMHRRDGLRAANYDPRAAGPINRPMTTQEDRLLLLALIGGCVRQTPRRYHRVLRLMVADGMGSLEISGVLGCSERWARDLMREGLKRVGARLRKKEIVT